MRIGDKVVLRKIGQAHFRKPPFTGKVLGISQYSEFGAFITVLQDGRKKPTIWAEDWWRKAKP